MPLRLSAGISKKMGLPNYGSLGATCHVEVELDAGLLADDLDGLHRHVRNAYSACSRAVNDELARHLRAMNNGSEQVAPEHEVAAQPDADRAGIDQPETGGNGRGHASGDTREPATPRQIEFIRFLASQVRGLGVRRLGAVAPPGRAPGRHPAARQYRTLPNCQRTGMGQSTTPTSPERAGPRQNPGPGIAVASATFRPSP